MTSDDSSNDLVPPDLKIRYSDFTLIGSGGMGRVLGAHDTRLKRAVAIKLLPANSENALAVMRFQQEAKAVSKLNNPHIVQVLDFGYTEGGEPYLVMERVEGDTLETGLETQGCYTVLDAVHVVAQICSALEHAHANEVVHRDLKTTNIMVEAGNFVKVLDFGLARIMSMDESDWRLTRKGQPVGSILYMSPEQVRGEESDERSDVYSLGLVIFRIVAGEFPYQNKSYLEIVRARLEEDPPAIPELDGTQIDKALRRELNAVVQKALSLRPEDRFVNMTEFKDALLKVSDRAEQSVASENTTLGPAPKSNSKTTAIVAVLLVTALAAVAYYFFGQGKEAEEQERKRLLKKHTIVITDAEKRASTKQSREALINEKFKVGPGDPAQAFWKADNTVTDQDLLLLVGIPISDLSIFGNHLITHKGIENLTAFPLRKLTVRETEIDDRSLPFISKMNKLVYLDFLDCHVTDKGIMQLSPKLKLIHLDVDKQEGVTDDGLLYIIKSFPHLQQLSISGTGVTRTSFRQLPRLRELNLLGCAALDLTDDDVVSISGMPLLSLDIGSNPLTDKSIPVFEKMKSLKKLFLDFCLTISPEGLEKLRADLKDKTEVLPPQKQSNEKLDDLKGFY